MNYWLMFSIVHSPLCHNPFHRCEFAKLHTLCCKAPPKFPNHHRAHSETRTGKIQNFHSFNFTITLHSLDGNPWDLMSGYDAEFDWMCTPRFDLNISTINNLNTINNGSYNQNVKTCLKNGQCHQHHQCYSIFGHHNLYVLSSTIQFSNC